MWAIKTQVNFSFPYLIMKYLFNCSLRKDIGYLPHVMIFMPFFQKTKIKVNEKMQLIMPNATVMIIVSNLHKMLLTLGDEGHRVKARNAPILSIPPTIR